MFENKDNIIAAMRKPMNIAAMALDELQARLGGDKVIADPNSPFCHLLEFGSSMAALCVQAVDEKLPIIYPKRAESMQDLYHHMSDFDYLKLYATPSETMLRLGFPKQYLINKARPYNENYKKLTIPKDTVFMIGRYPFGIYYPIDILINNFTNTFTVVYDTSKTSPLHALTKNIVDKYDTTYKSLEYIILDFPIYQFAKGVTEKSIIAEAGFAEKIIYNNKFYAARFFDYYQGEYRELAQTQSHMVYDSSIPTVLTRVLPDENKLQITIPQVYLDKKLLGSKLYIEIYTTLGALDINTANIPSSSIQINFSKKSKDTTDYSAIFKNLPFDHIRFLSSEKITGGTNPIDLDELRDRVVNDTLYDKVPISEDELMVALNDANFSVKKYLDNVTDRIYFAYRILEDGGGSIIPSISLNMRFFATYTDTHSGCILNSDNTVTILPTNMYEYSNISDDVTPLNDDEMRAIANMDKKALAFELNNKQYFKSPFHILVNLNDYYPEAISFNLLKPDIIRVIFDYENFNVSAKMMSFTAEIAHLHEGVGGYTVQLSIFKSDDVKPVPESGIKVYVLTKSTSGYWIGTEATYLFDNDTKTRSIYGFNINTNYHLTANEEIGVTNFQGESLALPEHLVKLEQDWYVVYLLDKSAVVGTYEQASQQVVQGVPEAYLDRFVGLSRQHLTIHLGHSLKNIIKNNVEVSATPLTYATWDHDVPDVYEEDVYKRDASGNLVVQELPDGGVELIKVASQGDPKISPDGDPILLHKKGDVRWDADGPLVDVDRQKLFYIDMIFIDAKVFASERSAQLNFVANMYTMLESYFSVLKNLQNQLLERTNLYFKCVRSTGTAKFNMGNGITSVQNVELSFDIICYVPSYVKNNESVQTLIKTKMCEVIEASIKTRSISMMEIFDNVKEQLSDYIDHFTLLGINGSMENQTFEIISEDAQPSLARKLVLTEDNVLSLEQSVDIEFRVMSDNQASTETYVAN